jgi:O-acetyl-ADP-ribose deacetylase (regulator of RNase III)
MARGGVRLVLASIDDGLADAWQRFCGDVPGVEIFAGDILDSGCDALVSPANSFGFMDGGIDGIYLDHYGADIQLRVRRAIMDHHGGELLVGAAEIVETDATPPFLIAAPTMRVPMRLGDSVNPYLAARAVFRLVTTGVFTSGTRAGDTVAGAVRSIAMPGLGTGVGGIGPNTCARQVRAAIDDVLHGQYTMPRSWAEASERHQLLYTDRPKRLQ